MKYNFGLDAMNNLRKRISGDTTSFNRNVILPQNNDLYRVPTALVQHSADRGTSHQRNVASSHIFNMVWLTYHSEERVLSA
jgi:hypothetical protein